MTRTRELQLAARQAPDGYIAIGRFLVIKTGDFVPLFGGLESMGMSSRLTWNAAGFHGWNDNRRRAVIASRNRRRAMADRLPRVYLP